MKHTTSVLTFSLVSLLAFSIGCSDDDRITRPSGPDPYPLATTPAQLVENLIQSYEELSLAEFDALLGEDFVFYFAPEDIDLSPGGNGFWARADELHCAGRMFTGQPGTRPDGQPQAAVQQIQVRLLPLEPTWVDGSADGPEFAGTLKRRYAADLTVTYQASDLISEVTGDQIFYVAPSVLPRGTEEETVYHLRAWKDLGRPIGRSARASVENASWGSIKSLFG